ncbi:FdhF/YdeP family oxidoreductase [Pseudoroseomonas ludipueritiae]|uniref:FdhF/YdeP family oxidoreductase n=1 Tax=Pseudoroseomonas ludipueritiae TaxID=198093 RepID=A0ABR7R268_9PROT|nr:FdhF/YdeP family oxidoreductase [Pseudoroseomonas ludipueritiae]MBC9175767.1 FdhF/YdeP family oxidoreductase [Pseudoroseomonas ludipueritiae]
MDEEAHIEPYEGPAGGWGSLKSVEGILHREGRLVGGNAVLMKQNKHDGFACVSCAWEKPAVPRAFEYCENGAKATAWEITAKRAGPDFFAAHTLAELRGWRDHDLEAQGRLTQPMRWDPHSDTYRPVTWEDAFREIGVELRRLKPEEAVFYVSGRASLEASYMWQLFARLYGTNNLPDSSNMCHESTSVALPESIGQPVGTVSLTDFSQADCIIFFGQNPGSNSPRMLHPLQEASKRGVPIITFNPLRERGLERFTNPQSPAEMLTGRETRISSQYHQVKAGGDIAAIMGLCKALIEADDAGETLLDHDFIAQHTRGFEDFAQAARAADWAEIERESGLTRPALEGVARCYGKSKAVIAVYGMGLTQHRRGVENVQMLVNLLLLRGNIGKEGAGICPVRGHSNVQGQRTIGISEKPDLVPLDKLAEQYNFSPPRGKGLNTVEACEAVLDGRVRAFLSLGGNFLRAVPETAAMEEAWPRLRLSVQIATKLNRSHLVPAEVTYLLPCLGRIEIDTQRSGPQVVSMEDSNGQIHPSRGQSQPASEYLRSEPAIIAGLAKAALPMNARVPWDDWVADYNRIRDAAAETFPDIFSGFNARLKTPGGFPRPRAARERVWKTKTGKANFIAPAGLRADPDVPLKREGVLQLITLRSNDQFNTTVYGYDDRFRGVSGTRDVVFIGRNDMVRLGLEEGQSVALRTEADDGRERRVSGLQVVPYDLPDGCIAAYYPECNRLIPLWHHAERSKVPAAKSVPVRVVAEGGGA